MISEENELKFSEQIDSYVRKYLKNGPIFCQMHNLDLVIYYETILKNLREGDKQDKAIALKLSRKLLDLKILNWKN